MIDTLTDAMVSLTSLMEEESEILVRALRDPKLREIAEAKQRLAGRVESEIARLDREQSGWLGRLPPDARAELADVTRSLRDAATVNAHVLERQIELSGDLVDAIAAEARRVSGARNTIYGARGGMERAEGSAPISVNTRL